MSLQSDGRKASHDDDSQASDDGPPEEPSARMELKRAYLQLSFAKFDDALESCRRAAELAPEHVLPPTIEGAIMVSKGQFRDAMSLLREVGKAHPDEPLPRVYLAEACLLAGRSKQGLRALDRAEELDERDEHRELLDELRTLWEELDPEDVPPPLEPVVAVEDDA